MLGVINNDTLSPNFNEWDCSITATGCLVLDLANTKHEKSINQVANAPMEYLPQNEGIHRLGDDILLHIFTFLPSTAIGTLPRVCSRWNQLIISNAEVVYQHLVQRLIFQMYLDQHKREQEEPNTNDIITIQLPPARVEQQFKIVGASSYKNLYQQLTHQPTAASELLSKLLFVLSTVDGAQARRLPATRSISKNSPSPRKGFHSPISASPLISTKASSYLSSLLLEGVDIEYLPKELFNLTFLRELDVSNNKLTMVPKEFANLKNLQILYLANNQISSIEKSEGQVVRDCISCLVRLEKLDFSGNRLAKFPEDWQYLHNLKELNVSNNTGYTGAKQLPISWENLSKLQVLWCSNNRIEVLPEEYLKLQCLQKLVADNNHIRSVPKSFSLLPQLRAISLRNNPIEQSISFLKEALPLLQIQYDPTFAKHSSLGSTSNAERMQNMGDGNNNSSCKGKEAQRKCIIQ